MFIIEYLKKRKDLTNILLGFLIFGFGIFVGVKNEPAVNKIKNIAGKSTEIETNADFSPFWKAWQTINEKYPSLEKEDQEKVYGAISGLVDSLDDPYSVFFDPEETKLFESDIGGSFGGVGIEIGMKDKILTVIAPMKNTPAYNAGIKSGDKIIKINDESTSGISIDSAIKMIRGDVGTVVRLTTFREGDNAPKELKITRATIDIPTLDTEIRPDGIFVIKLYSFSANSGDLFRRALKEFTESGSDKLLLDLRGNPGGYLEMAVDIASWFLDGGKTVAIEDFGENKEQKIYRSNGYDIFNENLKFVVLVDEGSASASEIFAGAMQDHKKAILVGSKSYGKGSVQEIVKVTQNTILKITVAKWLTPNGQSISLKGLTPDYEISISEKDSKSKKDPQLDKAVQLLKNWPGIK